MKKIKKYFYFPYIGGKSKEIRYITDLIDIKKYTTIIEPFCGSSAFSYYYYNINNKLKFHINDINEELINFLLDIRKKTFRPYIEFINNNYEHGKTTKEQYNKISKGTDLYAYIFRNKIYGNRPNLFPNIKRKMRKPNYEDYEDLDNFYMNKNVKITNKDYKEVLEKYKNDVKALIFLDPPYYVSYNQKYYDNGKGFGGNVNNKIEYEDSTREYKFIREALKNYKCKIIFIINETEIMREYFKDYYLKSYDLTYQMTKKKSKQITNIKI